MRWCNLKYFTLLARWCCSGSVWCGRASTSFLRERAKHVSACVLTGLTSQAMAVPIGLYKYITLMTRLERIVGVARARHTELFMLWHGRRGFGHGVPDKIGIHIHKRTFLPACA